MIRQALFIGLLIILRLATFAQTDSISKVDNKYPVDEDVHYIGGDDKFWKSLYGKHIKYPKKAVDEGISGTVVIYFDIDKNGHSSNYQIIKGVRKDLDDEALRAVKVLNGWDVSKVVDKKTIYHKLVGIKFSLDR